MLKRQSEKIKTPPKSLITRHHWRADLGRSVVVTTAIEVIWLTGVRAQPSHSLQQLCNQKDTFKQVPTNNQRGQISGQCRL